jgi:glycosyltransferase involved in cell wall biosynthesis
MNKLLCWLRTIKDYYTIKKSGLFDEFYYLANNEDVCHEDINPIIHYIKHGGPEVRSPSAEFDAQFYLNQYPDVKNSGMNPLAHYVKFGKKEGRRMSSSEISKTFIKQRNFTKQKLEIFKNGQKIVERIEGFSDLQLLRNSEYFDAAYYLRVNPDIKTAGIDPVEHYLNHGWKERRSAGYEFDAHFYLSCYHDIKDNGMCPLLHFLKYGKNEGRLPKPFVINEEVCVKEADISSLRDDLMEPLCFKIAVICHIFYIELAEELFSYIKNISVDYDLYLSTPEQHADRLQEIVSNELPGIKVTISVESNKGRDIAPFIKALKTQLHAYDLVCKIHTKQSNHDKNLLYWRKYLLDNLMGNRSIVNEIIYNFEQHSNLGIIYPLAYPYLSHIGLGKGWGHVTSKEKNRLLAKAYFPELEEEKLVDDIAFPLGSMFWFRPQALDLLREKQIDTDHFTEENEQIDATLAHAIERLFTTIAEKAGYFSKTTFFSSKIIYPPIIGFSIPEQYSKKIIFIAHDLFRAGAEMVLLHILNWLAQHTAIKCYVIAMKRGNDGGKLLSEYQKSAHVFLWEELLQDKSESDAANLLLKEIGHVDLIYGNTIIASRLYPYINAFNAPIVTHFHELEESIQRYTSKIERDIFRTYTSRFIACSAAVKKNLIVNHGIQDSKIDLIHEFIKTDVNFLLKRSDQRIKLNLNPNKLIIWGCGTIYWRKGVDLFIETAIKLRAKGAENFIFYWIGGNYWNEEAKELGTWEALENLIVEAGLHDTILFLGEKDNPKEYMKAGDIFYLPSREDPFPLVCLEAAECELPLICFDEAGGMPDFVESDAGIVVPYLDTDAAAEAIHFLISHDLKRKELGRNARNKILQKHSDNIAVPEILNVCHGAMKSAPLVSIIVPVYNHEKFLHKRIESILNQTFRDYEILILDDCSQDKSYEIAQSYLWHPVISVIRNTMNSGSPFRQWQKGIEMAKGSFIWIAEGDDSSESLFLETLLPAFNQPKVGLAFCASNRIGDSDEMISEFYLVNGHYENLGFKKERWFFDYTSNGIDEIRSAMAIRNTIPNVSAVLFRKEAFKDVDFTYCDQLKVAGDWYIYVMILKNHELFYSREHLNIHRVHSDSIVARNKKMAEKTIPDYFEMHKLILKEFKPCANILNLMKENVNKGLRGIWPDLSDSEFKKLYDNEALVSSAVNINTKSST